ncbi:MAG: hypothetical protein ACR2RB_17010 [Gammaproteobacteria bacterium]
MKVRDLTAQRMDNRARVAATVEWEDCERGEETVYFETPLEFAGALTCNPHAFLVASIVPALHFGERRIAMDEEICPQLKSGLVDAMAVLRHWYYEPERDFVQLDVKTAAVRAQRDATRAGFFFSGGVDSFATLRSNHLAYPHTHPRRISDGVLVFGLELDQVPAFDHVVDSLAPVAQSAGVDFIPVYSNLYLNFREQDAADDFRFWIYEFQGSALAAVAHVLANRLSTISIAATFDTPFLGKWGSHPLLDPNYSSADVQVHHDGLALSRLDKTRAIADYDLALRNLRVCNKYQDYSAGKLNCGECEKCVRTMLALLTLGVLHKTPAFEADDVSSDLVRRRAKVSNDYVESCYLQMLQPLAAAGRNDLVAAVKSRIAAYRNKGGHRWKARVKDFDRKYLNSSLTRMRTGSG